MGNEWILDVLADLKDFAVKNDLPSLAQGLSDLSHNAVEELAGVERSALHLLERDTGRVGRFHRTHGSRRNAGRSH